MNFEDIINQKREQNQQDRYKKFGLTINPFPKSGTANINEPSHLTRKLSPIDNEVANEVARYVADSLYSDDSSEDHKLIGTITGDYGTGKTQLLLFAKSLIQREPKKAFVIYISNPGTKLSELIGSIIENIGHEQFKRYIWNQVIEVINTESKYSEKLSAYINKTKGMFPTKNPFSTENEANHKLFLDAFLNQINDRKKQKEFNETLKAVLIEIIAMRNDNDAVIANYFYDLISEDFGINKTWETIISGSGQYLENKAVKLLNAIIEIVQEQGFERFYLLVDEFEDITSGRLTKKEVDNYAYNLRTLIDRERRWCLLIAMTADALRDLNKISPPLADRLTDRQIRIERLSKGQAERMIINYLNIARLECENSILPFEEAAINYIVDISGELPRLVLRKAHYVLERAVEELSEKDTIGIKFVKKHLDE